MLFDLCNTNKIFKYPTKSTQSYSFLQFASINCCLRKSDILFTHSNRLLAKYYFNSYDLLFLFVFINKTQKFFGIENELNELQLLTMQLDSFQWLWELSCQIFYQFDSSLCITATIMQEMDGTIKF
ncbi:unnamed protein product (macronuclear) [Paramecium tetraurelia]|uniref:Transmembrane protein n=1 Tax=Paramecium tetraurelia TaxID=5888 RepID=A0BDP9_PARTE|nr:uncharacterized protein GSPATT00027696001 [Paramecium tetraurelia]CAK56666.1 unnamed protein product [Paramecium tetraurelia]|eukprot:XP_001424064.1 hypothetical protein (macronuclear) [Paramecium tetraurelia strain d4-2]